MRAVTYEFLIAVTTPLLRTLPACTEIRQVSASLIRRERWQANSGEAPRVVKTDIPGFATDGVVKTNGGIIMWAI